VKIEEWVSCKRQSCCLGGKKWSVPRLHQLAKDLPVMEVPLDHLDVAYYYSNLNLREFVMHMRAVKKADLSYPIILDEDGVLMDGRHRLMKAMLLGKKTIKVVRFEENPSPCSVDE